MNTAHLSVMTGIVALGLALSSVASAESPYQSSADFAKYASRLREAALLNLEPKVFIPTNSRPFGSGNHYPWRTGIVTTTFWVGEAAAKNNPVHNRSSSWDVNWAANFGGYDNPDPGARRNFLPAAFTPRLNPFYVALPYNDVTRGTTKPEARQVIPWFKQAFVREGQSVCRDRWVAIRYKGKVCYAQWSDCGPFRTDHWQYVFGNERPKPNLNKGAGLDVSPAVRDFLGMQSTDVTDWKFVEFRDVPNGPWARLGENNTFVQRGMSDASRVARAEASAPALPGSSTRSRSLGEPRVLTR
jgi:hypothetical protein